MLTPNTLLQNRYLILRLLGQGGMGAVYEAKDQRLSSTVALKEAFFSEDWLRKAFEREARLLARLRHPGLPKVSDHFAEGAGQFLVMEFIAGEDLAEMMKRRGGPSPLSDVLSWGDQLLGVLEYLHKHDPPIIHRDIKPQNLKLTPQGEIVLLDFGLAKNETTPTLPGGSLAGATLDYAPPEQLKKIDPKLDPSVRRALPGTDARSDLYSLGATLYHLVTNQAPTNALVRAAVIEHGVPDPLRPAHEINPQVHPSIAAVLQRAMALDRERRYANAVAMRTALRDAPNQPTIIAPPPKPAAGQRVSRYKPVKLIGQGRMGETYQAEDTQTHQIVCLKQLRPSIDERSLTQQCQALARLRHANIVRLLDFDLRPPSPYLAQEFVIGPTLADYMRVHHPVMEPVVAVLGRQLFDALAYAQEMMIIHCDLKPRNVLLEFRGAELVSKILDFGLATEDRRSDRDLVTAVSYGPITFGYMAPEQASGVQVSEACDVYAVGQILWEMLTGRTAFEGDPETIIRAKRNLTGGLDPRDEVPSVSESLALLIQQCTRPDPQQRLKARAALAVLKGIGPTVGPPAVAAPVNLGFDFPAADGQPPPGWFNSYGFVADVSTAYEFAVIGRTDKTAGACVRIQPATASPEDFGSLMQRCPAHHLAGQRVRFEGSVRARGLTQWAGLWLRADGSKQVLFFDNMHDRPILGSTPWANYTIDARLPPGTEWLNFGIVLSGHGTIWADNLQLQVLGSDGVWRDLSLWNDADQASSIRPSLPIP